MVFLEHDNYRLFCKLLISAQLATQKCYFSISMPFYVILRNKLPMGPHGRAPPSMKKGALPPMNTSQSNTDFCSNQVLQVISCPQHMGDFTLPWPSGHSDTSTLEPSSVVIELCSNSLLHSPQVIDPTLMPHISHL